MPFFFSLISCSQTSDLSICAFPAVGVTCEFFLHSPHWSHAGRRGVAVLCQPLTWCSAEGLFVSPFSLLSPLFSFFFSKLEFGGHSGLCRMGSYSTHGVTHNSLNALHEVQTLIVSQSMKNTFLTVCILVGLLISSEDCRRSFQFRGTAVTEMLPQTLTGGRWFNKCLAMQKHTAVQTAMHPQTFNNQCSNEAAYEVTECTY